MKHWCAALAGLFVLAMHAQDAPSLFRVRAQHDSSGVEHRFGSKNNVQAIVFVFLGPECPISQRYVPELNRIAATCRTNAVEFYGVVSASKGTRAGVASFVREYAIDFPVLVDTNLALARWFRPTHVPEAFVLKPDGDRVYRGRIDDWYQALGKPRRVIQDRELRDAIDALLAGRQPPKSFAQPVGCYFEELAPRER